VKALDHALRIARESGGLNHLKITHVHPAKIKASRAEKFVKHHEGAINAGVAGRTDHLPMTVKSGSYVLPADFVSGLGEGNTIAGFAHMHRMFGGNPRGAGATPYRGVGGPYNSGSHPYDQAKGPYGMARGGHAKGVPIVAAGGEFVLSPEQVREAGGGDLERGHRVLDKWVLLMRKDLIKTLKKLPGPARN
jgi:hypothetical protein